MRSAFNLLFFPNSMFTPFFFWKGYVLSGELALINIHYYYLFIIIIWILFTVLNLWRGYFYLLYCIEPMAGIF